MNSSGIKRGLATSAIAALAITGVPAFASSASAAPGDSIAIVSISPVRNGGDQGARIQATLKGVTAGSVKVAKSDLSGVDANTPNQTIGSATVVSTIANGATGDSNPNDGLPEAVFAVPVTTSADGGSFAFALFEDEANADKVDATEARAQVSGTTAGAVKAVQVAPANQSAPVGVASGEYVLTYRDSAGRLTQMTGAEQTTIALAPGSTGAAASDSTITAGEATDGTAEVTATGTTLGLKTFNFSGPAGATGGSFTLDVVKAAANISEDELDVVAGVDDYDGFGDKGNYTFGDTVQVRVDQTSVRFDVRDTSATTENANSTLMLTATPVGTVRFGGSDKAKSFTTVLNSAGAGSISIAPDAGTITAGSGFDVTTPDGKIVKIRFERASFKSVDTDQDSYVSAFGGSVDVTVKSLDQFGNPIAGQYVAVQRVGGVNADSTPSAKKVTDATGTATFTLKDTKANAISNAKDDVKVFTYVDQFDPAGTDQGDQADIYYTADGQGQEFAITVDNVTPAGAAYDPASVSANPLTDAVADNDTTAPAPVGDSGDEFINLDTIGGTPGTPVTVTADNGALILKAGQTTLAQAKASQTGVIGDDFKIVGTKTGLTTVTVTNAGRTKTAQVTIKKLVNNAPTARNITVSGPEKATSGKIATFSAVVTDAFGNPVAGFPMSNLNIQVSGPGRYQDGDASSNAEGVISLNIRMDNDADAPVTVKVTAASGGTANQIGAAANQVKAADAPNSGPGLPASVATATATVSEVINLEELEQAVEDAKAAVKAAEGDLETAQANLEVAETELAVAEENVSNLTDRKQKLRKKLNKAKANDNKQKAKTTRKKLRTAKQELGDAKDAMTIAEAEVDAAEVSFGNSQDSLEAAQAALDEAQAEFDDAKNG